MLTFVHLLLFSILSIPAGLALYSASGTRQAEDHFPPFGDFIQVDGTRLHYLDRGHGPAIVLLHGIESARK